MATVAGVDPHLETFTVGICDTNGAPISDEMFPNTPNGWDDAIACGERHEVTVWAVEGTGSYGRSLCDRLIEAHYEVFEVPTRRTASSRKRTTHAKSDPIDALACARAFLETGLNPIRHIDVCEALRVLVSWRRTLVWHQTKTINRIKARVGEIDPGLVRELNMRSTKGWQDLEQFTATGRKHHHAIETMVRHEAASAKQRLATIRKLKTRIQNLLPPSGVALCNEIKGIGVISAATIIGEVGDITRFRSEAAFSMWAAAAPLDASSGNQRRHRYNRGGNRQMDSVFETAILTQLAHNGDARAFIDKQQAAGHTKREAFRSLKRHLARKTYRTLKQQTH